LNQEKSGTEGKQNMGGVKDKMGKKKLNEPEKPVRTKHWEEVATVTQPLEKRKADRII